MSDKERRTRITCVAPMRLIENSTNSERESKLWPKLANRTAAAAENQQAGFVLVSVTVFVSVSVLYIALVAASLFGVS